ncbi:MAG: hypothetical protein EOO02_19270 [Chitinophagaceae bacterium]|nr:MAG: hypothetical protein EOO02_19270 [Chitinophagaceae bacterium]
MKRNLQVSPRFKQFKLDSTRTSTLRIVREEVGSSNRKRFSRRIWIIAIAGIAMLVAGYFVASFVLDAINDETIPQQLRQPAMGGERTFL